MAEIQSIPSPKNQLLITHAANRDLPDLCYRIPEEANKLLLLSLCISDLITFENRPAIWVESAMVFSDEADLELLRGYMRGCGEVRDEYDAPATIFDFNECHRFLAFTRLALVFSWDAWIFETKSDRIFIQLQHDGFLSIWVSDVAKVPVIEQGLNASGFQRMTN